MMFYGGIALGIGLGYLIGLVDRRRTKVLPHWHDDSDRPDKDGWGMFV